MEVEMVAEQDEELEMEEQEEELEGEMQEEKEQ